MTSATVGPDQGALFDVQPDTPTDAEVVNEFFPTPPDVTAAILPHLPGFLSGGTWCSGGTVIEPAAGRGAICQVLRSAGVPRQSLVSVELRPSCQLAEAYTGDHRIANWFDVAADLAPTADLVITNPPFSLARQFAEATLPHLRDGSTLALFCRSAFTGSADRLPFHTRWPSTLYSLSWRPKFVQHLGSDVWDYGWFVWTIGASPRGWQPLARPQLPVDVWAEWERVQWA